MQLLLHRLNFGRIGIVRGKDPIQIGVEWCRRGAAVAGQGHGSHTTAIRLVRTTGWRLLLLLQVHGSDSGRDRPVGVFRIATGSF